MLQLITPRDRVTAPAAPPLPDVASATRLLDLQATALSLADGDPVSAWANAGTLGGSFTQSGSARPTYHAGGGTPYVEFDGVGNWMLGADVADNLTSFTIFAVGKQSPGGFQGPIATKISGYGPGQGWYFDIAPAFVQAAGGTDLYDANANLAPGFIAARHVYTWEKLSNTSMHIYADGTQVEDPTGGAQHGSVVTTFTTTEPVRIGATGDLINDSLMIMDLSAVMLYSPAPNASDRAAITTWLAGQYGVTL